MLLSVCLLYQVAQSKAVGQECLVGTLHKLIRHFGLAQKETKKNGKRGFLSSRLE